MPDYPRIIAHRCGGALAPENSLAGLFISARLGCRGVEFDVMLSADGVPLLIHDETLERTTTGHGRVSELTAAQIRAFDAGGPHHPAYAASPAPSFEEAMACCRALGLWANIEIKPATGHEAATGSVIGHWLAQNSDFRGVVSSFAPTALQAARAAAPMAPYALLVERLPSDWREQLRNLGATGIHLDARQVGADAARELAGTPWAGYTVNRRADGERLFALGASALFTDRPDLWAVEEM